MPHELPLNKVIPEPFYLKQIKKYEKSFPTIHDVHKGIVWTLERDPFSGTEVPNMLGHRIMKTYPVSPHTEFYVLFKYDDANDKVHLLSINSTGLIL
jgi:hypothetical protein